MASYTPPTRAAAPISPLAIDPDAGKLKPRRIQNALGSLLRTLIVAAAVAALVVGGRYAHQWYLDREVEAGALPESVVAAPDVRYASFSVSNPTSSTSVDVSVDMTTGNTLATMENGVQFVSASNVVYVNAGVGWSVATIEELQRNSDVVSLVSNAAVITISDVIPVEAHDFVTVVEDVATTAPGPALAAPTVFPVDAGVVPAASDPIQTAGNSDAMLDDVVDNIANPIEGQAPVTPAGASIPARALTISVDAAGLAAADPFTARQYRLAGASQIMIRITVDEAGVVRSMSTPDGVTRFAGNYTLSSATMTGLDPLALIDLSGATQPVEPGAVDDALVDAEQQEPDQ